MDRSEWKKGLKEEIKQKNESIEKEMGKNKTNYIYIYTYLYIYLYIYLDIQFLKTRELLLKDS